MIHLCNIESMNNHSGQQEDLWDIHTGSRLLSNINLEPICIRPWHHMPLYNPFVELEQMQMNKWMIMKIIQHSDKLLRQIVPFQ
jgi:hypothetical protein